MPFPTDVEQSLAGLYGLEIGFHAEMSNHLQYLSLLDWTGRVVRQDNKDAIPAELAPIVQRLGINASAWAELVTAFDQLSARVVGRAQRVAARAAEAGRRW